MISDLRYKEINRVAEELV